MTDEKASWTIVSGRPAAMLGTALVGIFLATGTALASGSLPAEPISAGPFANFAACVTYLEATHQQLSAMAMPAPVQTLLAGHARFWFIRKACRKTKVNRPPTRRK